MNCIECGNAISDGPQVDAGEGSVAHESCVESPLITESWLKSVGFKWEQFDRQPEKMWVLWLGSALRETWSGPEDLGIEVAANYSFDQGVRRLAPDDWFCWLRSDSSHRYHRFIHVRHLKRKCELILLIEALTGQAWSPANNQYGAMQLPEVAERRRKEEERLDKRMLRSAYPWTKHEEDEDRSRPSILHVDAAIEGGHCK